MAKKINYHFEALLDRFQLKKTDARLRVLSMLASRNIATSQPDLEEIIGNVNRATLYRILNVFAEKGIIHKVFDLNGTANYALCSNDAKQHHHDEHLHFNCISCNHVYCLDDLDLPELHLPEGFKLAYFSLSATGICPKCQKDQAAKKK